MTKRGSKRSRGRRSAHRLLPHLTRTALRLLALLSLYSWVAPADGGLAQEAGIDVERTLPTEVS